MSEYHIGESPRTRRPLLSLFLSSAALNINGSNLRPRVVHELQEEELIFTSGIHTPFRDNFAPQIMT